VAGGLLRQLETRVRACDGALALALTGLAAATDDTQGERLIGAQWERLIGRVSRRRVASATAAGGGV
jgi:hypothetical protein